MDAGIIKVDLFTGDEETDTVYFLTHAHTDHTRFPKRFEGPVYTSELNRVLLQKKHSRVKFITVVPDTKTEITQQVHVIAFTSKHLPGSLGFIFPKQQIVFMGDGVVDKSVRERVEKHLDHTKHAYTLYTDGLFTGYNVPSFPSISRIANTLNRLLDTAGSIYLICRNKAIVNILQKMSKPFSVHADLEEFLTMSLHVCPTLVSEQASINIVPMGYSGSGCVVVLSAIYFRCRRTPFPRNSILFRDSITCHFRIPFSSHASKKQNKKLVEMIQPVHRYNLSEPKTVQGCSDLNKYRSELIRHGSSVRTGHRRCFPHP
jgi:hypothetical protein